MGNQQSVRATHFQRSDMAAEALEDDSLEDHHISISNKMVERLVEDATLVNRIDTEASNPKGDYKEKTYIEKLKNIDDRHTERSGLTAEDLNALMKRVEMRTAHMVLDEPVCETMRNQIIHCYDISHPAEVVRCWDSIGEFSQCVQDASTKRLHARSERDARETERRSRHVARAREHALKDLSASDAEYKQKL